MTAKTQSGRRLAYIDYKWIALSNTTLGILMAALNGSIILIALPAIFRGIGVNPLAPGETSSTLVAAGLYGRHRDAAGDLRSDL